MELCFLAPAALHRRVEPYKRLVGVLLRPTCVSISISNPYLTLAEPTGAFLLRNGRVPERTLLKLIKPYCSELTGVVLGSEAHPNYLDLLKAPQAADTLQQVHAVLQSAAPGLPYTWWDRWTPDAPASCRIDVAGRAAEPRVEDLQLQPPVKDAPARGGGSQGAGSAERCSMGTLFLQHYLDNLGALNTFG